MITKDPKLRKHLLIMPNGFLATDQPLITPEDEESLMELTARDPDEALKKI
jgi:hypothetical protein